jgi:1,2-diacylglycerol 3-alpha-glucosyltransferase
MAISVAVLFYRIGPYHFARLRAAATALRVKAIEYASIDTIYAWDEVRGAQGFERFTLFPGGRLESQPISEIAASVGRVLGEVNPQVLAIPGWADPASLSALRWCLRQGVPAIVMSETTAWDDARRSYKEWVKGRVVSAFSAGLVGGTPHRDYLASLGMSADRVFMGYDAVDNRYFEVETGETRKQKAESRNKYGLPKRYFLASARFVEKKNLARLLQAYALYREKAESSGGNAEMLKADGRWDLVLLGDGPLRDTLNSQLSTLNLHGHVLLPGFKQYPDLPAYYGLASAFIHASTTEQWGLVVNEAMASGLPVLVSNRCGCAPDLVQEGVNGFTFDPCNIEQLAELMLKISLLEVGRVTPCAPSPATGLLTINSQTSNSLAEMGAASRRIIKEWGPERFASGLHQAVETALRVPRPRTTFFTRLILRALSLR